MNRHFTDARYYLGRTVEELRAGVVTAVDRVRVARPGVGELGRRLRDAPRAVIRRVRRAR